MSEELNPNQPCPLCNGKGFVDDGEIDCSEGGIPYENGPVQCVKDCPSCKPEEKKRPSLVDCGQCPTSGGCVEVCMKVPEALQHGVGPDHVDAGYADHIELIEKLGGTAKYGDILTANEAILAYEVARLNCNAIPLDELEALRRDAERYRALREMNWCHGPLAVVADPYNRIKPGSDCPSRDRLDEAIDAAITQQGQKAQPQNLPTGIDSEGGSHD